MKYSLAILALCLCFVGCSKKDEWPEFKTCERCKEADIKYWADVCKHCGKDPDGPNGVERRAELMEIWLEEQRAENDTDPIVEKAIRASLNKPKGELTKAGLAKVTVLDLSGTKITDAGLKELVRCKQLIGLDLEDTQITDAGLKEVAKLKQLTELYSEGTKVTKAGVAELQKALPRCDIVSIPTN